MAKIAEERLGDHAADPALSNALLSAAREGDELLVLDEAGKPVISQGVPRESWTQLEAEALERGDPTSELTKDRVIVVETVWNDGKFSTPIGTVVLERPTVKLNQSIEKLWLYVALLSGVAMIAAVLIAIYFARWVSRPLARLDTAARQIADGELSVRARTRSGPPELRRMAATFNMMAGRLETLVHGNRAMLADVSHQLRTPLTALRLRLDLLAADSGPTAADELAGAQLEIARLSRLVDGLLATARAESMTEQLQNIDVVRVTDRVAAWQPVADGHGVKLVLAGEKTGQARTATRGRARRGAPGADHGQPARQRDRGDQRRRGHRHRVGGGSAKGTTVITVADDGPGMTPQERSRAFLRFSSGSASGTGLGLAIVHRLVTSNGGTIRLEDTPGGGLTVVLEFPGTALHEGTNPAVLKLIRPGLGCTPSKRPVTVAIPQRGGGSCL